MADQRFIPDACALETVIATAELQGRRARPPDTEGETEALFKLVRELAESPEAFFQTLVETALKLSNAGSTGISLLNENERCFVWPAVAGPLNV